MDKQTQTILVIVIAIILIVVVLRLLFQFWETALVGGVAFVFGYIVAVQRMKKKK